MTGAVARVGTRRGFPAVVLSAGEVEAAFLPTVGMLGASLRFGGREHLSLHGGPQAYAAGHTTGLPLLAPWANRLGAMGYRVGSRRVDLTGAPHLHTDPNGLPIHGTMAGQPWEVVELDAAARRARAVARFAFGERPDLLASFPFPHELTIEAEVTPAGLSVTTAVRPTTRRAVPVSFGWHPYFRLPGVSRGRLELELPARDHLVLDEQMLPTGEAVGEPAGVVGLSRRSFDDGYRLGRSKRFALRGGGRRLRVELGEGYQYAQIYAPAGRPFVAIEPMTAPTDGLRSGRHPTVAPGERFSARFVVSFG